MQKAQRYKDDKLNKAVEELNKYRELQGRLEFFKSKRSEYEARYSELKAISYDGVKVAGGKYRNNVEEAAIYWEDINAEINRMQIEAERRMLYIQVRLNALTTVQARVLKLYYIECKPLIEIARQMGYSFDGIKDLKKSALKKFAYS